MEREETVGVESLCTVGSTSKIRQTAAPQVTSIVPPSVDMWKYLKFCWIFYFFLVNNSTVLRPLKGSTPSADSLISNSAELLNRSVSQELIPMCTRVASGRSQRDTLEL